MCTSLSNSAFFDLMLLPYIWPWWVHSHHGHWPTVHIQVSVWYPVKHLPTYHHMYRTLHLRLGDCIFFSIVYGNLPQIDHMLGHKASMKKLQWIQIIQSMLFYYNGMKLKINSKMITSKSWFICKISSILLYNSYVKVKIMGIRKLNVNENIYQHLCGIAVISEVFVST